MTSILKYLLITATILVALQTPLRSYAENKGALPAVSEDIKVGTEQFQRYKEYLSIMAPKEDDPATAQRLHHILQRLAAVSDLPSLPYEVRFIQAPIANAGSLPGGKILFYEGLWDKKVGGFIQKKSDEEIAAIMAHEIAHAAKRHWARITYGKEHLRQHEYESEADYFGMISLARAGYNPKAAVRIFSRRTIAENRAAPTRDESFSRFHREWEEAFASHPENAHRVHLMRSHLNEVMQIYHNTKKSSLP